MIDDAHEGGGPSYSPPGRPPVPNGALKAIVKIQLFRVRLINFAKTVKPFGSAYVQRFV